MEDAAESDLIFHVVDAGDPQILQKIEIVDNTLRIIGVLQEKRYIFNKIDTISSEERAMLKSKFAYLDPLFLSAESLDGIDMLKNFLFSYF